MTETIPILLYHSVSTKPPTWVAPFTVTPRTFASHLDLIVSSGRTVLTVSQLEEAMRGRAPMPRRPLLVTFDDGFADFLRASDELASRNLPSTLYATTGALVGRGGTDPALALPPADMLSWSQVQTLPERRVEVGAHTHTHPQLDVLPPGDAADEIPAQQAPAGGCTRTRSTQFRLSARFPLGERVPDGSGRGLLLGGRRHGRAELGE